MVLRWEVRFVGGFLLGEIVMKTSNLFVTKLSSGTDTQHHENFSENSDGFVNRREKNIVRELSSTQNGMRLDQGDLLLLFVLCTPPTTLHNTMYILVILY